MAHETRRRELALLKRLLGRPTAPLMEENIAREVRAVAAELGLPVAADAAGNLLVKYARGRSRPLALAAHMDHPGFIVLGQSGRHVRAAFRGYVEPPYFAQARVAFFPATGKAVRGKVAKVVIDQSTPGRPRVREAVIDTGGVRVPAGTLGTWDLGPAKRKGRVLYGLALDDLAGVAIILSLLYRLHERGAPARVLALFTRAEETGFSGAIEAARRRVLPSRAPVVSLECSRALAHTPQGHGPILRIGDRMTVFSAALDRLFAERARKLAETDRSFRYQRALMDGGSCEATAFGLWGYETYGLALPLGNYHNMNRENRRLGLEYIHLDDYHNAIALLCDVAANLENPAPIARRLRKRLLQQTAKDRELLGRRGAFSERPD